MNELREYKFYNNVYLCDKYGNIYNKKGHKLRTFCGNDGYKEVELSGGCKNKNGNNVRYKVKVHIIVATLFVTKKYSLEKLEVNHIDNNRMNSYYKNLEWVTHKENIQYCIKQNRNKPIKCKGSDNVKSKLFEDDVLIIRKLYEDKISPKDIHLKYNYISYNSILSIIKRRTWKHI